VEQRLVVVPHTHWDREWYRTHEEFRYRLVRLMDGLLDLLETDPSFRHFTLDGQTIVVDDYLEVRPQAQERIAKLVEQGRLLLGPWYVLPDEWLVSGEALVRNLRRGLAGAAAFGGSMQVGYVPDQFGHVGQLPQIFAGFGMQTAILWRGVGSNVERTLFHWAAPDGTELLTVYLLRGYGNAAQLPLEPGALAARLAEVAAALAPRSPIPSLLLLNGSDHLEPQRGLPAALEQAAARLDGFEIEIGGLAGYAERVHAEAPEGLTLHRGELRSGLRAPLLEGCASARMPQKRADFFCDRLLTRYLEPLCAWLAELGGDPDLGILAHAWEIALQNHPHDSICGCSIDAVHDEMDARFARLDQLGRSHLRQVAGELASHVALPEERPGPRREAGEGVVVWNPHPGGRSAFEGSVELDVKAGRSPEVHLQAADGRRVPVSAEVQEPAALLADHELPGAVAAMLLRGFPGEFMGLVPRAVALRKQAGTRLVDLLLGEDSPADFDFASAREVVAAQLVESGKDPVRYRVRRLPRLLLRGVDELPGHGLRVYRVARGRAGGSSKALACAERKTEGGARLRNDYWIIEVAPNGRVDCEHLQSGVRIPDALRLVSEADRGDEYNFDPVEGEVPIERPERVRVRPLKAAEGEAAVQIEAGYRVPVALRPDRAARTTRRVRLPVRISLRLLAGLDRVDLALEIDNTVRDHRLRVLLRAPFAASRFEVESAFEVAERPIDPAPESFGSEQPAERPIGATPQRSFASIAGSGLSFTVANRGSAEVEALPQPDGRTALAVTLLRAVGWLSRGDLRLRPVLAGPPLETPGAQVPGPHRAELSFRLGPDGEPCRTLEAHRFAAPGLLFAGGSRRGRLRDGARLLELDDPCVVVSAVEPGEAGRARVRFYNATSAARTPRLRWRCARPVGLEPVDLRGLPDARVRCHEAPDGSVRVELGPWQIATLEVSPR
jgi:hypothetical protein